MDLKHEMVLEKTYPTGAEEWTCPACGRRMLITWQPKFKRTVLEAGNVESAHTGFKSSLPAGDEGGVSANEKNIPDESHIPVDEARLAPWEAWLENTNFESLWDRDD